MSMPYELAKQLKDAGFPTMYQRAAPNGLREDGCFLIDSANYKIPTLEELIDACGKSFLKLEFNIGKWWAQSGELPDGRRGKYSEDAATPTEAVARLWLALNPPNQETK